MQLDHIGLEVQDLFTMELFYRQALGFAFQYRYVSRNTPGLRTVFLKRGELSLELLERPREEPLRTSGNHVALQVEDVDAEYTRVASLAFKKVMLKPPRNTGDGFREAELRDPEGNVIELSARVAPEPFYPIRAVIFDLDGTLLDSEPNYFLADHELLARYGIEFTKEDKKRYIGGSNIDMMKELVRRYRLPLTPEALAEEKNEIYLNLAERNTLVYPAMRRLLELVIAQHLPAAVASGSAPHVIRRLLKVVGLNGAFQHVVSAEDVPNGKPAPDIFLETARRLGLPAETCLVVEDSCPGVEAASRAFMRCIAVPYLADSPLPAAFGMADLLFSEGMDGFDPERAANWIRSRQA